MTRCPNCEKNVSDYVANCPNCGMALSEHAESRRVISKESLLVEKRKNQNVVIGASIVLLVIAIIGSLIGLIFGSLIHVAASVFAIYSIIKYQLCNRKSLASGTVIGGIVALLLWGIELKRAGYNLEVLISYLSYIGIGDTILWLLPYVMLMVSIICLVVEVSYLISNREKKPSLLADGIGAFFKVLFIGGGIVIVGIGILAIAMGY